MIYKTFFLISLLFTSYSYAQVVTGGGFENADSFKDQQFLNVIELDQLLNADSVTHFYNADTHVNGNAPKVDIAQFGFTGYEVIVNEEALGLGNRDMLNYYSGSLDTDFTAVDLAREVVNSAYNLASGDKEVTLDIISKYNPSLHSFVEYSQPEVKYLDPKDRIQHIINKTAEASYLGDFNIQD